MCDILFSVLLLTYLNFAFVTSRNSTKEIKATTEQQIVVSDKDDVVWCRFQPNGYDCNDNGRVSQSYYFDTKLEDCKVFTFGSCKPEQNKFDTLQECRNGCLNPGVRDIFGIIPARIYCKFQPEFGLCNDYYPKFYYDVTTRSCKGFSYSGCGGNLNRFTTPLLCATTCGSLMEKELN